MTKNQVSETILGIARPFTKQILNSFSETLGFTLTFIKFKPTKNHTQKYQKVNISQNVLTQGLVTWISTAHHEKLKIL